MLLALTLDLKKVVETPTQPMHPTFKRSGSVNLNVSIKLRTMELAGHQ